MELEMEMEMEIDKAAYQIWQHQAYGVREYGLRELVRILSQYDDGPEGFMVGPPANMMPRRVTTNTNFIFGPNVSSYNTATNGGADEDGGG